MIVVRFYAQEPALEPIAKYVHEKDPGDKGIRELCRPIVANLKDVDDAYKIISSRIADLDKRLAKDGYERVPVISTEDHDRRASVTYDAVISVDERTITVLSFDLKMGGEDVEKKLRGKYVIGRVLH